MWASVPGPSTRGTRRAPATPARAGIEQMADPTEAWPKPPRRIVDPQARPLDEAPLRGGRCPLCGGRLRVFSRAHVVPRSLRGDDLPENLAWLCGDGARGCHGCLTHRNRVAGHPLSPEEVARRFVRYCRERVPLLGAYADRRKYPGWLEDYYLGAA